LLSAHVPLQDLQAVRCQSLADLRAQLDEIAAAPL